MKRLISLLLISSADSGVAQDIPFSTVSLESCLSDGQSLAEKESCIGASAEACINTPDGYTTVGMGFCYRTEASYWDERLNVAFAALMDFERSLMAEMEGMGGFAPDAPGALRDMQRAWIGFRDATCAYEYASWGGGTGGGPANAACLMTETARQALVLENHLSERQQ